MPALNLKFYLIACFGVTTILCISFFPTMATLNDRWNTSLEAYSHGYYIAIGAIILALTKYKTLAKQPLQPSFIGLLFLAAFTVAWLAGEIAGIRILKQLTLPALGFSLVTCLFGFKVARVLLFPFAIIYSVIPVWDVLVPTLQAITVSACSYALSLINLPAFIDGNRISIPAGNFEVASGCSGLSYFLMNASLGLFYGHLYLKHATKRLQLFFISILLGLACNWVRVFLIIIIGEWTNMKSEIIYDHGNFGLVVYAFFLVPFIYTARKIEDADAKLEAKTSTSAVTSSGPAELSNKVFLVPVVVAMLSLYPNFLLDAARTSPNLAFQENFLASVSPLVNNTFPATQKWKPSFQAQDFELNTQLISATPIKFNLHVSAYLTQNHNKELIGDQNKLFNSKKWKILHHHKVKDYDRKFLLITKNNVRLGIVYWYAVGNSEETSETYAKLKQAWQFLFGRTDAALFAISFECSLDCNAEKSQAIKLSEPIANSYNRAFIH